MTQLTAHQRIERLEEDLAKLSVAFANAVEEITANADVLEWKIIETANLLGNPSENCCKDQ